MSDTTRGASKKRENPSLWQWLYRRRRLILYLSSFVLIVAVQTLLYWWGMRTVEGDPRSLLDSFGVVVQSLTTTGYGQDAPWDSGFVSVLVVVAQFTGIAYIFVAFPLFIVPWIRDFVVEPTVPETIEDVEDHVLLSGDTSLFSTLVADLESRDQPYVVVETDIDRARSLYEDGRTVVSGSMADTETLRDANVGAAKAIVVDSTADDEIGTTLAVGDLAADVDVVCLVDDPGQSRYLRYAGATVVLSPKHRLGKSLADMARNVVPVGVDDLEVVGDEVEVAEFPVAERSDLFGRPLADLDELEETGATLVGAWMHGAFVTALSSDDRVDESTTLIVAGTGSQLDDVAAVTRSESYTPRPGPVLVVGHGIVGLTAEGILRKAGRDVAVVGGMGGDADGGATTGNATTGAADAAGTGADGSQVVGDATDEPTLREAGIDAAGTVIVALADDEAALRTVLVARHANPDARILVVATAVENADAFRRAGADSVLAIPKFAARMATLELFDEDVMALSDRIQFTRTVGSELAAPSVDTDAIRRRTDAVVVAVRRDGDVLTDLERDLRIAEDDELIVAGTADGISEFRTTFCE